VHFLSHSTKKLLVLAGISLLISSCSGKQPDSENTARTNPDAPTTAYVNGNWFDLSEETVRFLSEDRYSQDGVFVSDKPSRVDTTIDLNGAFIIPPFGDAHNHAFADGYSISFSDTLFFEKGIYYALNLTNPYSGAKDVEDQLNSPRAMDVAYAHGGFLLQGEAVRILSSFISFFEWTHNPVFIHYIKKLRPYRSPLVLPHD
jgi:hypothetical protein